MTQNSVTPKAIPTRYAGYHFRSRLEARWAVFFDSLGWKWQYEPQGYELPSGNYLPDFRLLESNFPFGWNQWIEIKGQEPSDRERRLAKELALASGEWVTFLGDIPRRVVHDTRSSHIPPFEPTVDGCGVSRLPAYAQFCCCCSEPDIGRHEGRLQRDMLICVWRCEDVERALVAARSARFEHGHSGAS